MEETLAVDFDDVVPDFNGGFIAWHNEKYGTSMQYSDLYTHDMAKVWRQSLKVMLARVNEFLEETDVRFTPLIPGAKAALTRLATEYDLQIVTARSLSFKDKTEEYLRAHGLHMFSDVHFTNEFNSHPGYPVMCKSEMCRKIKAIALIEDAPKHIAAVVSSGIRVLVPDRPWNLSEAGLGITRFRHWSEVPNLLKKI